MQTFAVGDAATLNRPCIDCGRVTGNYCDSYPRNICLARLRKPRERWEPNQRTPFCRECESHEPYCRYCRAEVGNNSTETNPVMNSATSPVTNPAANNDNMANLLNGMGLRMTRDGHLVNDELAFSLNVTDEELHELSEMVEIASWD